MEISILRNVNPPTTHRPAMSFRISLRPLWRQPYRARCFATARPPKPPPFPTVSSCPSPTCGCAATPTYPDGLEIDRKSPLNGVISGYAEQVIICTGKDDWSSRIEDENSGDNLAADLKELFGRGGQYTDVCASPYLPMPLPILTS